MFQTGYGSEVLQVPWAGLDLRYPISRRDRAINMFYPVCQQCCSTRLGEENFNSCSCRVPLRPDPRPKPAMVKAALPMKWRQEVVVRAWLRKLSAMVRKWGRPSTRHAHDMASYGGRGVPGAQILLASMAVISSATSS